MTDIRQRLADLPPEKRALFEERLAQSSSAKSRPNTLVRDDNCVPEPSFGQERLWALEQIEAGAARYNLCYRLSLKGILEVAALKTALSSLVNRHETLRTLFIKSPEGRLQIAISATSEVPLNITDFSAAAQKEREELLSAALRAEANRPIVLDRDPVIRAVLYRLGECEHVLQLTIHHVASDGWSMEVLFRDFAAFYNAEVTHTAPQLPELPIAFSDYAHWQRQQLAGPEGERLISYWKDQLRGSSSILELPTDRPRPPVQTFCGADRRYSVPATLATAIREFCVRKRVTPFMVALAALYAVLARYSGQNDILIGSTIAARPRIEVEDLVGYFTNTVILRGNLDGDPTFLELLQQVKQTTLGAYAHQDLPIDLLMGHIHPERDIRRAPIFQVMLVYQNAPAHEFELHGLKASIEELKANASLFDLVIELLPSGDALDGAIQYNSDLFDSATIDRLWAHLTTYIGQAIEAPQQRSDAISLVTRAERQQLLVEWNATARAYPLETPLAALVEAQVERTPEAIAVVFGEQRLTYRQLNECANQLARELAKHGAGPDQLVGLFIERSTDLVVALLAIVKAGAGYLPLDPLLPAARLRSILEDSSVRVVLTGQSLVDELPAFAGTTILLEDSGWGANSRSNLAIAVGPEHRAYVIYTSGSTGKPKGVQVLRGALTNLLWSMREWLELSERDRLLAVTTISFDIAGVDIWLPLLVGAQTVVARRDEASDGNALRGLLERHDITFLQATPVTWRLLFDTGWRGKPNLQTVCTGEAMPPEVAAQLVPAVKRVWNLYGPTETTIWSTGYRVTDAQKPILIGRPVANTQCYILDGQRQPVPVGVTGELYIGGGGLARGYLNNPELTAERFLADSFREGDARMYRTGDLARYQADGNIECLGRIDHQVKIRGYRIELGEIETALRDQPEIAQAVVIAREDAPGDKRLVAYLVASAATAPKPSEVRRQLNQRLPDYMLPSAYLFLDHLPISPNGKIDRKSLEAPQAASLDASGDPRSSLEETLARIWAEVLSVPRVGIHDDFFEMGGHSLLAVRLFSKILAAIPECQPTLALLLKAPTVAQFAQTITDGHVDFSYLARLREGGERPPIFFVCGAGGNALSMRDLALALPPDQPFYGLQGRGLDGHSPPFSSVEEAAECYVEQIRSVQSHGPYFLGGVSYGGIVAVEMACRLRSAGEAVGMLALVDTYNYAYGSFLPKPTLLYFNSRFFLRRTLHHMRILVRVRPRDWSSYLLGRIRVFFRLAVNIARIARGEGGTMFPKNIPSSEFKTPESLEEILSQVKTASLKALQDFIPKPYDGHLLLFRASVPDPEDPYLDVALGWRPVVRGGVTVSEVDGDHFSIMYWPKVAAIAEKLDSAIREAQRNQIIQNSANPVAESCGQRF